MYNVTVGERNLGTITVDKDTEEYLMSVMEEENTHFVTFTDRFCDMYTYSNRLIIGLDSNDNPVYKDYPILIQIG